MAGHSHWAGIKHKKGRADKERSKIFSKLSREITVAAKLGDKDPLMNPRLRSAIQAARSSNMPKDNIERAIDKSKSLNQSNFEKIRYEGFGKDKVAIIVEALTDNKNRTASKLRTIFQKKYQLKKDYDFLVVDLHCETTSEKMAMGHLFDSKATLVTGTHTHIPTNDARVLKGGTAYITDSECVVTTTQ